MLSAVVAVLIISRAFAKNEIKIEPRIANGFDADRLQFPYYVLLLTNQMYCGGTPASSNVILTAGHCLVGAIKVEIRLGSLRARKPMEIGRKTINVFASNIHIHPEYTPLSTNGLALK